MQDMAQPIHGDIQEEHTAFRPLVSRLGLLHTGSLQLSYCCPTVSTFTVPFQHRPWLCTRPCGLTSSAPFDRYAHSMLHSGKLCTPVEQSIQVRGNQYQDQRNR